MTNGHLKVDVQDDGKKVVRKKKAAAGTKVGKAMARDEKNSPTKEGRKDRLSRP